MYVSCLKMVVVKNLYACLPAYYGRLVYTYLDESIRYY